MVDQAVIQRLLVQLEEYFRDLDEIKSKYMLVDYKKNKIIRRYTERTLQVAIEVCLDLASHIISYKGFREPLDNKDCFQAVSYTHLDVYKRQAWVPPFSLNQTSSITF